MQGRDDVVYFKRSEAAQNAVDLFTSRLVQFSNTQYANTDLDRQFFRIINDPGVDDAVLVTLASNSFSISDLAVDANPDQIRQDFPDWTTNAAHTANTQLVSIFTGVPAEEISDAIPSLGLVGAQLDGVFAGLLYRPTDPFVTVGTVLHDLTSTLDSLLSDLNIIPLDENGNKITLNGGVFGAGSIQISAVLMWAGAMASSIANDLVPQDTKLFDFIGVSEQQLALALEGETQYFETVTNLGNAFSQIASKLVYFHADQDFAVQVATDAAVSTIAGYTGDQFALQFLGRSLDASTVLSRFAFDLAQTSAFAAKAALADVFNETFSIEDPLGQFVTTTVTSAVINVAVSEILIDPIEGLGFDTDALERVFGLPQGTDLRFDQALINGELVQLFGAGLSSFVQSQLFSFLDAQWDAIELSNIGASIGGVLGSTIAPGVGTFIGQVAGGIVYDLFFDKDPESFHSVSFDSNARAVISEFLYARDGGDPEVSEQLAGTARDVVQLVLLAVGGQVQSIDDFSFGYIDEDFVFRSASSSGSYGDANTMLRDGIFQQLRTLEVVDGNPYALDLISRPDYAPTIEEFLHDISIAQEYGTHKVDPVLYGTFVADLPDTESRDFILEDWLRVLDEAQRLGFRTLNFDDAGEFLPRTAGSLTLVGTSGNDYIYSTTLDGGLVGGDGNDFFRVDSRVITAWRGNVNGGTGVDTFAGDFSAFELLDITKPTGISFSPNSYGMIYSIPSASSTRYLSNIEHFEITSTSYNDVFTLTSEFTFDIDAGQGFDSVNLKIDDAVENVIFDMRNSENQLIYGASRLKGFEDSREVRLGSGNDRLVIDTAMLSGPFGYYHGGAGIDIYDGDFSSFDIVESSEQVGIEFSNFSNTQVSIHSPLNGNSRPTLVQFESFEIKGTRYNDRFILSNNITFKIDAYDGFDTISLLFDGATDDVVLDLRSLSNQLIFGASQLSGFEDARDVAFGSGNDYLVIDDAILSNRILRDLEGGAGLDTYVGDFSSFEHVDPIQTSGIRFHTSWTGTSIELIQVGRRANFSDFERFEIIATQYDDVFTVSDAFAFNFDFAFDGAQGFDTVNLLIGNAVEDAVLDIRKVTDQLIYGGSRLDGFEDIGNLTFGRGNDRLVMDTTILKSEINREIQGGQGIDTYIGDFSDFERVETSETRGISFGQSYPFMLKIIGNSSRSVFYDFEHFEIIGTRYDDVFVLQDGSTFDIDGGVGRDTVSLRFGAISADTVLDITKNDDQLVLGSSRLRGFEDVDFVSFGSGNDRIVVNATILSPKDRNISGGDGVDTFIGNFSGIFQTDSIIPSGIRLSPYNSIFMSLSTRNNSYNQSFISNFERFEVSGTQYEDSIHLRNGNDRVLGLGANDFINAGAGSDTLNGGDGNDTLEGGDGDDRVFAEAGDDSIDGGAGNDLLEGKIGDDTILGGAGADTLRGSDGSDLIDGGDGDDVAFGGNGDDTLIGGAGDDTLDGSGGNDSISGGDGNDVLVGENGADTLDGGAGNDTLRGSGGNDLLMGGADDDLVFGSSLEDTLFGGDGDDVLDGNQQADQLFGEAGNDTLRGGDGFDALDGGAGDDVLAGGNGEDVLVGGLGVDILRGGANADTFRFLSVADSAFGAADLIDGIEGVGALGGDVIDLSGIDADIGAAGDQAFTFIGVATTVVGLAGGAGTLWLETVGAQTRIYGIVDNDGTVDLAIRVNDGAVLAADYTAGDFLL